MTDSGLRTDPALGTSPDGETDGRPDDGKGPRAAWPWLGLLWVLVTAYNLAKPFHIDDTAHLEIARWIAGHPLHPMSGMLNWSGVDEPIYDTNQPHLYFYLLAGWASLFGWSEIALHTLQSVFALACVVLFHRQARRFCPGVAVWLTALLVLGPAFVVEQNLMVDVPLLALWLLFFELLLLHRDSPAQTRRYVLAGFVCGAAILTKYSSLTLLPVLAASLLLERRVRQAWTVLIPVAVLAAWSAFNWWDYGGIHVLGRDDNHVGLTQVAQFGFYWLLILGAVTPLGFLSATQASARLRRHERTVHVAVLAALVLLAVAVATGLLGDRWSDRLLPAGFALNALLLAVVGVPAVVRLLRPVWRDPAALRRDPSIVLILLWFLGGTAFYLLFAPFIAVRHVLLVIPPVLLFFGLCFGAGLSRWAKGFGLGLTVLVAAGLCLGDWQFASFYKTSAAQVAASLPPTDRVWTSGHWGWQWYAEEAGMRQVNGAALDLREGDWVVVGDDVRALPRLVQPRLGRTRLGRPHPGRPHLVLVRQVVQQDPGLSLFCTARGVRFYSTSAFGPWSLSRDCVGHLSVYRVES